MADDDALQFLPLFPNETEAAILARMRAWANEGLDPDVDVDEWVDTREGSQWHVCVMPGVREAARLWDSLGTEVVAAGFPVWAWGDYLDDHAEQQDIVRLAATNAGGDALFVGPPETVIAAGMTVSVEPVDPDQEVPEFEVTTGGELASTLAIPSVGTNLVAGGTLVSGTVHRYLVTAFDSQGEALPSPEQVATPSAGNLSVHIGWGDIAGAVGYRVYRKTGATGPPYDLIKEVVVSDYTDTGVDVPNTAVHPPSVDTSGGWALLPVRATIEGVVGNVAANAITQFSTPPPLDVEVSNPEPMTGGTEAETDEALRERVLGAFQGQGAGNKRDYERWGRDWAGVGRVTVIPLWDGPNTVKVIAMTAEGGPVSPETIDGLQNDLDPVPGQGEGRAPVGAIVTVDTAAIRLIDLTALIEFEPGYSLDGFGGAVARRATILAELAAYIALVESGGEVVVSQLQGRITGVQGVHDAKVTVLEGVGPPAVNVAIDDDPAEVPRLGTVTLTESVL